MLSRLFLAILCALLLSSTVLARTLSEGRTARSYPPPPILARAGVAMDALTGEVLAAKNLHLALPMASTTKIMTAVLALRLGHLDDRITVPSSAFDYESDATVMGLHPGMVVTLRELLYGLLLPSGADAANTIAIRYGGSERGFVARMNAQAAQLGMHDTHFVNAHGLTASGHHTSAYDLALLARFASAMPDLMQVVSTRSHVWNGRVLTNLNAVLFWYPGVDGIKPGFTDDAGLCQVLDAQRNGRHVVVALLNTPNLDTDSRNLLNFGLRDFTWVQSRLPYDHPGIVQSGVDPAGTYYYFPASGHYLRGAWWRTFVAAGGLATLGFPRTEPLAETGGYVQYFQNGALSFRNRTRRITRVAVGLTPLPTLSPTPTPLPLPTATPTPVGAQPEGSIVIPTGTVTITPSIIRTPRPTPTPRPTVLATPLPTAIPGPPTVARLFAPFQRAHASLLGGPAGRAFLLHGYFLQVFAYGAVVYDGRAHAIWLLPVGDHLLAARHFLAAHPGNSYPAGFAPPAVLRAMGWNARLGS